MFVSNRNLGVQEESSENISGSSVGLEFTIGTSPTRRRRTINLPVLLNNTYESSTFTRGKGLEVVSANQNRENGKNFGKMDRHLEGVIPD